MKKSKNGRTKEKNFQFKRFKIYYSLLICCIAISVPLLCIFYTIPRENFEKEIYAVLAVITFLAVVSGVLAAVIAFIYKKFILKPIEKLSNAAKKVADGDFTIRLEPVRKDGKKDRFEVLFEDFNTMVSELESTEILKKDFVSNISHELKTPLSVIQNLSAMLKSDGLTDQERKEYANKIYEATKHLSSLVTNILQLSRLENQKVVVNKKNYNLSEQLCRCIINYEQVWESKNIEINTDFDQNLEIYSDESLLEIVWNNLLSNAVKFTPENGKINISIKKENSCAVVKVEDNGCGMSEHDLKHIFDKFYQADTSHATKGNGLGLALVKEIINLVKGTILVKSEIGKGSQFTISLVIDH